MADNPFDPVLAWLWDAVESSEELDSLFQTGNRIKRTRSARMRKLRKQDADLPEIDIVPLDTPLVDLNFSSSAGKITEQFQIIAPTGARDETAKLFKIKWRLIQAVYQYGKSSPAPALRYVTDLRITEITYEESDLEEGGARRGWVMIMTVAADLNLDRTNDLLNPGRTF